MIPASGIDRLLLACCDARWRKVARIIGQTYKTLEAREIAVSRGIAKLMETRMAVLVRSGKLEAKGNVKRWGYSEVRLVAGGAKRSVPQADGRKSYCSLRIAFNLPMSLPESSTRKVTRND